MPVYSFTGQLSSLLRPLANVPDRLWSVKLNSHPYLIHHPHPYPHPPHLLHPQYVRMCTQVAGRDRPNGERDGPDGQAYSVDGCQTDGKTHRTHRTDGKACQLRSVSTCTAKSGTLHLPLRRRRRRTGTGDERSEFWISTTGGPADRKFLYKSVMICKTYGTNNGRLHCRNGSSHTIRQIVRQPSRTPQRHQSQTHSGHTDP